MLKNCQKGATMIEVIGVMGVISVITVGLFATVAKVFDRYHQAEVVSQIRDLQKNIQARFATACNYTELNDAGITAKLIDERVIPSGMVVGDRIVNAYGGTVNLNGTQYEYTIQFAQLKKSACMDLLMMDWSVNNTSDLVKLTVDGKTYSWNSDGNKKLPVSPIEAAQRCKDEQELNVIEWTFQ